MSFNSFKIGDYVISKNFPRHLGRIVNINARILLVNSVISTPPYAFKGTYGTQSAHLVLDRVGPSGEELIRLLYE